MATNIVGTFPILNSKTSQTDEYGFDYVSYQYTIKTVDLLKYNIKKDDVFTGIEDWIPWNPNPISRPPAFVAGVYVVDTVENENMAGGLTRLTVNTIGTKISPELSTARVCLISGGPLIFGLIGTPPPVWEPNFYPPAGVNIVPIAGYGTSGAGQSVEIKYLSDGVADSQSEVFGKIGSQMPSDFRGVSLPIPARTPHKFSNIKQGPMGTIIGTAGSYFGFVCRTISTEKRGSLILVTLIYSEAGFANDFGFISGKQSVSLRYNFPKIG